MIPSWDAGGFKINIIMEVVYEKNETTKQRKNEKKKKGVTLKPKYLPFE